jgi:hypothetical protein
VTPIGVTPGNRRTREDRWSTAAVPLHEMQLLLPDSVYTDRLAAFLRSVGQQPVVSGPSAVDVGETPEAELQVYLRVWSVLYPDAEVRLVA